MSSAAADAVQGPAPLQKDPMHCNFSRGAAADTWAGFLSWVLGKMLGQ